jgi:hypothetical protein
VYLVVDGARFVERGIAIIPRRHHAWAEFFRDNLARVLGAYRVSQSSRCSLG